MASNASVPPYHELLWPTLLAVRSLGHSATIDELVEQVIDQEGFTDAQLTVLHKSGPRTEIEYRLAWARTYLKGMSALTNPSRGIWETTRLGREIEQEQLEPLRKDYLATLRAEHKEKRRAAKAAGAEVEPETDDEDTDDWREELLQAMLAMSPEGFERLAQRLLRAAGFINTSVTARSGDGGIDGMGVYRLSLVSFPVFFQCKRYRGSVGPEKVRDFRGAMAGRGDKGLLITTGTFTTEATREATRAGAPPIDLIDGEQLCELLKQHRLGVRTTERVVEDVEVVASFFEDLG
ncbi:MAG TPA: restriction endonuclease [Conexibacter sp.]|nr:restriction endonuclease [Conexibacter sp.]